MDGEKAWQGYYDNMQKIRGVLSGISGDNPYDYSFNNSHLWVLKALTSTYGAGYPSFMANEAWNSKRLITFTGAIADSNHPTYLIARQGERKASDTPDKIACDFPGYVEPEVSLYTRLEYMARYMKEFLTSSGFKNKDIYYALDKFLTTVTLMKNISIKELENEPITEDEGSWIRRYGRELQDLSTCMVEGKESTKEWDLISIVDRSMASVSDAYIDGNQVLQTAVGFPDYIYVVVPSNNKYFLTRGSVYSYYEFEKPISKKVEDRAWKNMLKDGSDIKQQIWIKKIRY
jgi:hypothetical protein